MRLLCRFVFWMVVVWMDLFICWFVPWFGSSWELELDCKLGRSSLISNCYLKNSSSCIKAADETAARFALLSHKYSVMHDFSRIFGGNKLIVRNLLTVICCWRHNKLPNIFIMPSIRIAIKFPYQLPSSFHKCLRWELKLRLIAFYWTSIPPESIEYRRSNSMLFVIPQCYAIVAIIKNGMQESHRFDKSKWASEHCWRIS